MHDFVAVIDPASGHAILNVGQFSYTGFTEVGNCKVLHQVDPATSIVPTLNYMQAGKTHNLKESKIKHLKKCTPTIYLQNTIQTFFNLLHIIFLPFLLYA